MNSFFRKLRWLIQRPDKETELQDELQFHLETEAEQKQEAGRRRMKPDGQRAGNWAIWRSSKENTRAARRWMRPEQFASDAAFGFRQIRKNLAFSSIAIATLALGIGGIAATFSAFDAMLIRPLP